MGGRGLVLYCDDVEANALLRLVVNDLVVGFRWWDRTWAEAPSKQRMPRHASHPLLSRRGARAITD